MIRGVVTALLLLSACRPQPTAELARCQRKAPPWLQADCIAADRQARR